MSGAKFVYVTYIRTTPEKLWQALIDPEFTRQYWVRDVAGMRVEARRVVEDHDPRRPRRPTAARCWRSSRRRRLVLSWRNEFKPELRAKASPG